MVQGQRLLLSLGLALALVACKAEDLGVVLPRGGVAAISQEDLRRDSWRLAESGAPELAAGALAERLGQMRTHPGFGGQWSRRVGEGTAVCGRKDGQDEAVVMVLAVGPVDAPAGAIAWAGLISLAKGLDDRTPPPLTVLVCGVPDESVATALVAAPPVPQDALRRVVRVGPYGGEALSVEASPTWQWIQAAGGPLTLGEVDYRRVEAQVRETLPRLLEPP